MHYQLQLIDCLTDLMEGRKARLLIIDKQFGMMTIREQTIQFKLRFIERYIPMERICIKGRGQRRGSALTFHILVLIAKNLLITLTIAIAIAIDGRISCRFATLDVSIFFKLGLFCLRLELYIGIYKKRNQN